jgi:hypothetical protein
MADRDAVDSHFNPPTAEEGRVLLKGVIVSIDHASISITLDVYSHLFVGIVGNTLIGWTIH